MYMLYGVEIFAESNQDEKHVPAAICKQYHIALVSLLDFSFFQEKFIINLKKQSTYLH